MLTGNRIDFADAAPPSSDSNQEFDPGSSVTNQRRALPLPPKFQLYPVDPI